MNTKTQSIPGFDEEAHLTEAPAPEADPVVEAHIAAIDFALEDLITDSRKSFESVGLTAVVHPGGIELWKISGTMKEFIVALSTENIVKAAAVLNKVK